MAKRGRPKGSKNKVKKTTIQEAPETKLTKFQTEVRSAREAMKTKANKRKTSPGPWTDIDPSFDVKAKFRLNTGIMGETYGTYVKHGPVCEKGWYPLLFNITSKSIRRDVEEHGLDNYIAACEKSLNDPENKKKYGTVIILQVTIDHSSHEERGHRFLSCYAKTNKKSIKGFSAIRKKKYQVL